MNDDEFEQMSMFGGDGSQPSALPTLHTCPMCGGTGKVAHLPGLPVPPTPARHTDPGTSALAGQSVSQFHARTLHIVQLRMLVNLQDVPSARTHEGLWNHYNNLRQRQKHLPLASISGFRTRLSELKRAGYVRDSGLRMPISTGRKAVVWDVTMYGIAALRAIDGR